MATTAEARRLCSHVPSCELFPRFGLQGALKVWRTFYCEGNFESCARFRLASSGRPVPPNLLPNGRQLDLKVLGVSP